MKKVFSVFRLAARAFSNLKANNPVQLAAATAFFTFFALPPIVIILSQLYDTLFIVSNQQLSRQLFYKLAEVFGHQSARQLLDISQHLQQPRANHWLTGLSVLVLLLAATTLFAIIKNSLNQIWSVKPSTDRRIWHAVLDKIIALGIILFSGFLFVTSLTIHQALLPFRTYLSSEVLDQSWLQNAGQHSLSILVLTIWFAVVFKYLPDIKIRWRAVWTGALVTGFLIELGENLLNHLLINSPVSTMYGTSGAIILILLFVFYASLIFYYGASFTRYYAEWIHQRAKPGDHAVAYQIREIGINKTNSASQ